MMRTINLAKVSFKEVHETGVGLSSGPVVREAVEVGKKAFLLGSTGDRFQPTIHASSIVGRLFTFQGVRVMVILSVILSSPVASQLSLKTD